MRTRFFADLLDAAQKDPNIVLVTGDLGFGVIEPFVEAVPEQFINAGVAEQNMTGLAAGIALSGGKVFTYSIANFPILRPLEQIRNDVAYHGADVVIVAVGGGLAYGALGMSHHATEDLAIMRAIPGLVVAAPGDPVETSAVLADLIASGGPAYLRLGKAGERTVHEEPLELRRGEVIRLRQGEQVCLVSTGAMLPIVSDAAELLEERGVSTTLLSVPWISPFDHVVIAENALAHQLIVSVEEHTIVGGLGGAVAEVVAETPKAANLLRIGLPHRFSSAVGDQNYLRDIHGLTADGIVDRVTKNLEETT